MKVITGVFFQDVKNLRVGHDEKIEARVMLQDVELQALFIGVIGSVRDTGELRVNIDGVMNDHYGSSTIHNFVLTKNKLTFLKIYDRTGTPVKYSFKKGNDKFWAGTWKNPQMEGITRCAISDVGENWELFDRGSLILSLKK